ncbi:MAG: DMT family transporter [Clostridiaceae bacterium]|nr:DMT family transporter [Clostridiaceae bacterium]
MKLTDKKLNILSKIMLFTATVIWGSSFFILKNTLDEIPVFFLLCVRFGGAVLIMSLVFIKHFKNFSLRHLWTGAVTGVFLGLAYITQTVGLKYTTPGVNAFLTSTYCILVPFMMWYVSKKAPDKFNFIAAFTVIAGIGLVCIGSGAVEFSFMGEGLTMICGIFFAAEMVAIEHWGVKLDVIIFTIVQFAAAFVCCLVCFFAAGEKVPTSYSASSVWSLAFLTVLCTVVCFLFMNVGIKHTSASYSAIVTCLEAVFGVLFSIVFYHEKVTLQIAIGFAVIFIGVLINETKLSFIKKKKD